MNVTIYLLEHKENKDLNYVGSTIQEGKKRFSEHHIIMLFGKDNIIITYLLKTEVKTNEDILKLEQKYINNIKPNLNIPNPHPETAVKYKKKDIKKEVEKYSIIKCDYNENDIKLYPKNPKKYGGYISIESKNTFKPFRIVFEFKDFKYYESFKTREEAENKRIQIAIKNNLVYNIYYLKYDEIRKEEYYEVEIEYRNIISRTKISLKSIDIIEQNKFYRDNKYVIGTKNKYLHEFICERKKGESIDHINKDKLDNRIFNLRSATPSEQARNQKMRITNKTGFTGVSKNGNRYLSRIRHNNKEICNNFSLAKYGDHAKLYAICNRNNLELLYDYKKWDNKSYLFVDEDFKILE